MALRVFTVAAGLHNVASEPADAVEAAIAAALVQEDIDASEDAEAAVEAIRTAHEAHDVRVVVSDANDPTREEVLEALEQVKQHILRSNLYTEAWYAANEE